MRYIQNYSGNRYAFSGSLSGLFENLVKQPINNHPPTQAWQSEVKNRSETYHREIILDRGRTNFDEPFNGLTPEDKVLIYCAHYMPMHLVSSYHIFRLHAWLFRTHFISVINKIVFIDFGCGPLTSGIAFWAFARMLNGIYLGVEHSRAMRNKAQEINQYGPNQYGSSFYSRFETISDYSQLTELLDNSLTWDDKIPIIFNFCYFLASRTLNINDLSDVIVQIMEKYSKHNMCIVYQNPNSSSLRANWETLKANLSGFKSVVTQSNIQGFHYDSLTTGLPRNANVYYDILFNG